MSLLNALFRRPLVLFALFSQLWLIGAAHASAPQALHSRAVLVVNANNGKTLYQKQANRRMPIASLSKLMTAMVVLDNKRPMGNRVKVTAADRDLLKNTHSRLTVGSTLSRRDMLHIALMSSENRAAAALSRYYPGGRRAFVAKMNQKARALGMAHTRFYDPTGLTPRNVSTARDLLKMVNNAYRYQSIRHFSTDKQQIVRPGRGQLVYRSSNGLINNPSWKIQLQKTGFTNEAGHCLIMRTVIKGQPVIMILLGSQQRYGHYSDAIRLKQWLAS
ncbi:D-alanyl-D-alanine endopeptidase [Serratia odorifera]|uniref:Serine-type D-Ala-D-Ala carboxypeptidase n=2 Tax=Serratia odorifera TaxID=618 RepID=D4E655_SEROD|nr:D-alanyl-D-alanine endopeptidase [Serratia odorifera]EFE94784.1 serine-type D-Ala-D-Ala carboxypeptidase [Serratia odorifera DSM 4582]MBJ2064817.1 D-alanyl-D-alanine endopeptidase [Serratia odorifera]PNK89510.1 D-alanyl-D-alanine endopeptidase [Serratia odorifera]RII70904.1 D-alanyl-D-alanine endopeptidase [Serratia odorifera]VDZ63105.1 D-alanyl-D-alanine endopeptidase precursor [Serratia odorifera]